MNKFCFVGHIDRIDLNNFIKKDKNGANYIRFPIYKDNSDFAFVQMFGENRNNMKDRIRVTFTNGYKGYIDFKDKNDSKKLSLISDKSKYKFNVSDNKIQEYIYRNDFIEYFYNFLQTYPNARKLIYRIEGDFRISYTTNTMPYYNFNIRKIAIDEYGIPKLALQLDLFYNYKGLNMIDKRNRFILNSFIYQYSYSDRKYFYYPLEVYFKTNNFDFTNTKDIKIIRNRKEDMSPKEYEGYVKSSWVAYYRHGADLVNLKFNKKTNNANFNEYAKHIYNLASNDIYLTEPILNDNTQHYHSLNISNEEFENRIKTLGIKPVPQSISLDELAMRECQANPFN